MSKPIPILLLSDSPDCASGLARITRDLATRLYKSSLPIRVATAGFNGVGAKDLGFQQYQLGPFANSIDIPKALPAILDWFGGEQGIVFTIYDLPRLEAFRFANLYGGDWARYLGQKRPPFYLAGYLPIDADCGPEGFPTQTRECLRAFDKLLAYGPYGQGVLEGALGFLEGPLPKPGIPGCLPHGLDRTVWCPRPTGNGKAHLKRGLDSGLKDDAGNPIPRILEVGPEDRLLGVVATNQARKDYATFFKVAEWLADKDPRWKFWVHTDKLMNAWSIPDLVELSGLNEKVFISSGLPDDMLAELYSDCEATFGIGLGEGFGYPLVESLACGTPAYHIDYAGGADLIPEHMKLDDNGGFRAEGPYCLFRPVLQPSYIAAKIQNSPSEPPEKVVGYSDKFDWGPLWRNSWLPWWKETLTDFEAWKEKV